MSLKLDKRLLKSFVQESDIKSMKSAVEKAHDALHNKTGAGNDYVGWVDLPSRITDDQIKDLENLGKKVREDSDCVICIGIGGSYLGIRSTLEAVRDEVKIPIYYAGHNMSADYLSNLLVSLDDKRVSVVVISKSGTTTEPALAFRIVKKFLIDKYGEAQLKDRIICVTDEKKGALRQIVNDDGYRSYVIPDDIGGRFSVLTPVGLVPLAIAGVDIAQLVKGARDGQHEYGQKDLEKNICYQYAVIRNLLYKKGKKIEVLSSFYDNMQFIAEWWKQLYGESEGKNGKGIFPASMIFSTDLHSMGQMMQDGERVIFETFLMIDQQKKSVEIPSDKKNLDGFNFIAGKDLDYVNKQAYKGTAEAHFEGGVPSMTLTMDKADAYNIGRLYYFFEKAVGISGYLLGVNPFDQPGVEAYKKKMSTLLGKK